VTMLGHWNVAIALAGRLYLLEEHVEGNRISPGGDERKERVDRQAAAVRAAPFALR
jgi:hypothetical protein